MITAHNNRITVGFVDLINMPDGGNDLTDDDYRDEIYALKNGMGISLWNGNYVR